MHADSLPRLTGAFDGTEISLTKCASAVLFILWSGQTAKACRFLYLL